MRASLSSRSPANLRLSVREYRDETDVREASKADLVHHHVNVAVQCAAINSEIDLVLCPVLYGTAYDPRQVSWPHKAAAKVNLAVSHNRNSDTVLPDRVRLRDRMRSHRQINWKPPDMLVRPRFSHEDTKKHNEHANERPEIQKSIVSRAALGSTLNGDSAR